MASEKIVKAVSMARMTLDEIIEKVCQDPTKKVASKPACAAKSTPIAKKAGKKIEDDAKKEEQVSMNVAAALDSEEKAPKKKLARRVESPRDEELPEFDPDKFEPGYVPKTVKKGDEEYAIVVTGVKDTGLCGGYWGSGSVEGKRRRSKPQEKLQVGKERRGSVDSVSSDKGKESPAPAAKRTVSAKATPKSGKKMTRSEEAEVKTPVSSITTARERKRRTEAEAADPGVSNKKAKREDTEAKGGQKEGDSQETVLLSSQESALLSSQESSLSSQKTVFLSSQESSLLSNQEATILRRQQAVVAQALTAGVPGGQQRVVSCVADSNTKREVLVECFAQNNDLRWANIGKERDEMSPDAVQYARALRPPYHLLSFLRIKGHSTKGMSCTDRNTMVFVVLEGEVTVTLHTTQFNAKKGDSFYIPPKNDYQLINQAGREVELSLVQFQYDGPLPTVQEQPST